MVISFEEEIESKIADRIAGTIFWGGLACIIIVAIFSKDEDRKQASARMKCSERPEWKSSVLSNGVQIKEIYTISDIANMVERPPSNFDCPEFKVNVQRKIREKIRCCLQMGIVSSSTTNIYGKFFGDDDRDEINLLGVAKFCSFRQKVGDNLVNPPQGLLSKAREYEQYIVEPEKFNRTDFMKLIDIMRSRLHKVIDKDHITNKKLYKEILEQPEHVKTICSKNDKKEFHIFKIDNWQFPVSKTLLKDVIIPVLKGSESFYKIKDILDHCKAV